MKGKPLAPYAVEHYMQESIDRYFVPAAPGSASAATSGAGVTPTVPEPRADAGGASSPSEEAMQLAMETYSRWHEEVRAGRRMRGAAFTLEAPREPLTAASFHTTGEGGSARPELQNQQPTGMGPSCYCGRTLRTS